MKFKLIIRHCNRGEVWSDYWTSGEYSVSHGIDRVFSKLAFAYCVYIGFRAFSLKLFLFLLFWPTFLFVMSAWTIVQADFGAYVFCHSMWHVGGGLVVGYIMYYGARRRNCSHCRNVFICHIDKVFHSRCRMCLHVATIAGSLAKTDGGRIVIDDKKIA